MLLMVFSLNFPLYLDLFLMMFWLYLYLSHVKVSILPLLWFILGQHIVTQLKNISVVFLILGFVAGGIFGIHVFNPN